MGYPVAYRSSKLLAHPNTAGGAFKRPQRYKPANDNIPRKPPKPANDNIPRTPPKPANDNFAPPVQKMNKRALRYGWIRGAGLAGNLGGFQFGSPWEVFLFMQESMSGLNGLNRWVVPEHTRAGQGWTQVQYCGGKVLLTRQRGHSPQPPCSQNLFTPGANNNDRRETMYTNTNLVSPGAFTWRISEQWEYIPAGTPNPAERPVNVPSFIASSPYGMPYPGVFKWADPWVWPVAANDPGPIRIPQSSIRARGVRNPLRVPAESWVRGYDVPIPSRTTETLAPPSFSSGTGQTVVEIEPDGGVSITPVPNTHAQERPPKGVRERKVKATRKVLLALDLISRATEAKDMLDCFFTAVPYDKRQAYAKWRIMQQRAAIRKKWPSITHQYVDYLLRQYRINVGNHRDIVKEDGKHVRLPAYARDNKKVKTSGALWAEIKKLDDVSSGSTRSGFSIAEKIHLIQKYWNEIDWMSEDEPQVWDGKELPSWKKFDGMNGVLPCLLANQIDDVVAALPGMSLEQAYKSALDAAGINPDRITGLEFGPQQFDQLSGLPS